MIDTSWLMMVVCRKWKDETSSESFDSYRLDRADLTARALTCPKTSVSFFHTSLKISYGWGDSRVEAIFWRSCGRSVEQRSHKTLYESNTHLIREMAVELESAICLQLASDRIEMRHITGTYEAKRIVHGCQRPQPQHRRQRGFASLGEDFVGAT